MHASKQFPAHLPAFDDVEAMVDAFSVQAALAQEDVLPLLVLLEELFTGSVRRGSPDGGRAVSIRLQARPDSIDLVYEDSGVEFNPLAAADPPEVLALVRTGTPGSRRSAGLGVALATARALRSSYGYHAGRNRIEVRLPRSR